MAEKKIQKFDGLLNQTGPLNDAANLLEQFAQESQYRVGGQLNCDEIIKDISARISLTPREQLDLLRMCRQL